MKKGITGGLARARLRLATGLVTILMLAGGANAAIPGNILKTDGTVVEGENIRYRASMRQYVVQRGSVELSVNRAEVERVMVQEPPGLRNAVAAAQRQPASAIPALQQIVKDYAMLEHDIVAARWLGEALIKSGRAGQAADILEDVVNNYGFGNLPGDLISVYLDALTESGETARVRSILDKMIQEGSRGAAAVALMKRGDLLKKEGKYKEALIDGYLRVIVLFADEKTVQPESLFGAAGCFEELGQAAYAEKMRKKLMAEYPQSTYTRKIQSGS